MVRYAYSFEQIWANSQADLWKKFQFKVCLPNQHEFAPYGKEQGRSTDRCVKCGTLRTPSRWE